MTEISLRQTEEVPLPIRIRRHEKARNMILRLSPTGRELLLTLPHRISEKKGLAFVRSQSPWISSQIARLEVYEQIPFTSGLRLPLFGQDCLLVHQPGQRGVFYTGDRLVIGGDAAHFPRRVRDWIRQQARRVYRPMAVKFSDDLGCRIASVTLRDTRSRWGSCSVDGKLSFCWRLAFAPQEIARYVVAHEVAHLRHFDHSPAFWRTVARLHPDWETARDWLQEKGKMLHRYG